MLGGQFIRQGHIPADLAHTPIIDLKGFTIAWLFFGYSTTYIVFIGLSQVIGGLLLLSERTKLFGIALLLPVLLNIIIVDICYEIPAGALLTVSNCFVLLLVVLYMSREKVINIINAMVSGNERSAASWRKKAVNLCIARAIAAGLFLFEVFVLRRIL